MEETIVTCKGNFGLPNKNMKAMLDPVDKEACLWPGHEHWGLVKGEKYKFIGDLSVLKDCTWFEASAKKKVKGKENA